MATFAAVVLPRVFQRWPQFAASPFLRMAPASPLVAFNGIPTVRGANLATSSTQTPRRKTGGGFEKKSGRVEKKGRFEKKSGDGRDLKRKSGLLSERETTEEKGAIGSRLQEKEKELLAAILNGEGEGEGSGAGESAARLAYERSVLQPNREARGVAGRAAVDMELEMLRRREKELDAAQQNFERQRWWQKAAFSDRCLGCGAALQSEDSLGAGYLPAELVPRARKQPLRSSVVEDKKHRSAWAVAADRLFRFQATEQQINAQERKEGKEGNGGKDLKDRKDSKDSKGGKDGEYQSLHDLNIEMAEEGKPVVCQRCHSFRSGNFHKLEGDVVFKTAEKVRRELAKTFGHQKYLAVVVVDLVDVSGSWIEEIEHILGGNPVLLVGNKYDLLPKGVNEERVRAWLKKQAAERGLTNVRRTVVLSAFTGHRVKDLVQDIEELRGDRDVVLLGATNVGKSTLLNGLVPRLFPGARTHATTSAMPGTTLNLISFPFSRPSSRFLEALSPSQRAQQQQQQHGDDRLQAQAGPKLIDTPGLVQYQQLDHLLTPAELNLVHSRKRLKPVIVRLVEGKTLFMGGMARVDYVRGPPLYLSLFMAAGIKLHPTDLSRADDLYQNHLGTLLQPPFATPEDPQRLQRFPALQATPFVLKPADIYDPNSWRRAFADICVSGLGWLSLTGGVRDQQRCRFVIHAPPGVGIYIRPPLMPFEAEPPSRKHVIKHGKVPPSKALLHPLTRPRVIG